MTENYNLCKEFLGQHCKSVEQRVEKAEKALPAERDCFMLCFQKFQMCYTTAQSSTSSQEQKKTAYNTCMDTEETYCMKYCQVPTEEHPVPEANALAEKAIVLCDRKFPEGRTSTGFLACFLDLRKQTYVRHPSECIKECQKGESYQKCLSEPEGQLQKDCIKAETFKCKYKKCDRDYCYEKSLIQPPLSEISCVLKCQQTYNPIAIHHSISQPLDKLRDKFNGLLSVCSYICENQENQDPEDKCYRLNAPGCAKINTATMQECFTFVRGTFCKDPANHPKLRRMLSQNPALDEIPINGI